MDFSLTDVIEEMYENYSENCCKYILLQALQGLKHLHEKHIVHRDIKSDNILVDQQGQIKLADFGYSAQLTQERGARSTKFGTPHWMAPELISGKTGYDTRIDIWSFGILAIELANRDPPYMFEGHTKALSKIVMNDPPRLLEKWSPLFRDFVSKCLVKDPNLRPSASEMLDHEFLQGAADYKEEFIQTIKDFKQILNAKKKIEYQLFQE